MRYIEYKIASRKHLQTCEYMVANLKTDTSNKLEILCNVYYLCGYSLECIVNFWIFELLHQDGITFTRRVREGNVSRTIADVKCLDHSLGDGKHLCFSKRLANRAENIYWLDQHNFQKNIEVFQHLANGDSLSSVPIIGDSENEPYSNMLDLFYSWEVEVRYQNFPVSFPYTFQNNPPFLATFETDISNFVRTTRLIYDELEKIQRGIV